MTYLNVARGGPSHSTGNMYPKFSSPEDIYIVFEVCSRTDSHFDKHIHRDTTAANRVANTSIIFKVSIHINIHSFCCTFITKQLTVLI